MKDVFYEIPRLPMYMVMEEQLLTRVRALRYTDGKLNGVLVEWDVAILGTEFDGKKNWSEPDSEPFYCIYKDGDDYVFPPYGSLKWWVKHMAKLYEHNEQDLFNEFIKNAQKIGCPIFNSYEEARTYVFGDYEKKGF